MKEESCRQCVPCRDGAKIFCKALDMHIAAGGNKSLRKKILNDEALKSFADSAEKTSICAHGKALGIQFKKMAE
jgi:NADH:ubiquinone oxidoreductase subunit F (NADH-binding)